MQLFARHPRLRWAAPGVAVLGLAGGVGLTQAAAGAGGDAPPLTAQELLVAVQQAKPVAFSGEARTTLDLGLPALAGLPGGAGGASLGSLISGSHDWRVWYDGTDRARLALVDGAAESDIIHSGSDVWVWSSAERTATHLTLPARPASTPALPALPGEFGATLADPQQAAALVLKTLDPSTKVGVTSTDRVAGRAAYGLVLTPRSGTTKVGSVHLSIDAETKLPLALTVTARGASKPAIEVTYTSLTYAAPPASVFAFAAPPGTKVTTKTLGKPGDPPGASGHGSVTPNSRGAGAATQELAGKMPRVTGAGWDTVVVVPLPKGVDSGPAGGPAAGPLGILPKVSGQWGAGRLLESALFSAVLTDDGRLAVGAVAPAALYAALG